MTTEESQFPIAGPLVPEVRAVADGRLDDDHVLLSLVVLPRAGKGAEAAGAGLSLGTWPSQVRAAFADPTEGSMDRRVQVGPLGGGPDDDTPLRQPAIRLGLVPVDENKLDDLWRKIMRIDVPLDMEAAQTVFTDAARGDKNAAGLFTFDAYDSCSLARQFTRLQGSLAAFQAARVLSQSLDLSGPRDGVAFNPLSPWATQSAFAHALLTNGTETRQLTDPLPASGAASDEPPFTLFNVDALLARIAWVGRRRPGAAPQSGFVGAAAGGLGPDLVDDEGRSLIVRSGDPAARHPALAVGMNDLLRAAVDRTVKRAIASNTAFEDVRNGNDPSGEDFLLIRAERDTNQPTEREETLTRLLRVVSPVSVAAGARGAEPHPIDTARASYELALLPELAAYLETRDPALNGRASSRPIGAQSTEDDDAIVRRITGLLAYPDVARLFGLIVDLKVPVVALKEALGIAPEVDPVAFEVFGAPSSEELEAASIRSAVRLTTAPTADGAAAFAPLSIFDEEAPADPPNFERLFENGVVRMAASHRLLSIDVNQGYESAKTASQSDDTALSHGEPVGKLPSSATTLKTAGIALVDACRTERAYLDRYLAYLDAKPERLLYLEDLVQGYRIDVAGNTSVNNAPTETLTWTSACGRSLEFPQITDRLGLDAARLRDEVSLARDRMTGAARSPHREMAVTKTETDNGPEDKVAVPFQTVATWRSWTLGAPAIRQKIPVANGDLNLAVKIGVDGLADRLLPQRYGGQYAVGARYTLLNGSSIGFAEAIARYNKDAVATKGVETDDCTRPPAAGATDTGACCPGTDPEAATIRAPLKTQGDSFPFYRQEPVAAPKLLLTRAPSKRTEKEAQPHLDEIVAAAEGAEQLKWNDTRRFLLSERAPFNTCLLHGILDRFTQSLPRDSYSGLDTWPPLKATDQSNVANPIGGRPLERSHVKERYYADPMAQILFVGFFKDGEPAPLDRYPAPVAINLYPWKRTWPDAMPVEIEARAVTHAGLVAGSRQRAGLRVVQLKTHARVQIEVEPAEIAEVWTWCTPFGTDDLMRLGGFEALGRVSLELEHLLKQVVTGLEVNETTPIFAQLPMLAKLEGLFNRGRQDQQTFPRELFDEIELHDGTSTRVFKPNRIAPIHGISHTTRFRAIHAVRAPLARPEITRLWAIHEIVPPEAKRTDRAAAAQRENPPGQRAEDAGAAVWIACLEGPHAPTSQLDIDLRDPGQEANSQRVLVGGSVRFDRRSTAEIQLLARWKNYSPETRIVVTGKDRTCRPDPDVREYKLADLQSLAYEVPGGENDLLDLLRTPWGQLRLLTVDLNSPRAARLRVRAVARSRFARYFKPETPTDALTITGPETVLTLPATGRPDPVKAPPPEPTIRFDGDTVDLSKAGDAPMALQLARRRVTLRVDLGPSWYSSGEGERLGVVCAPVMPKAESAAGERFCVNGKTVEWHIGAQCEKGPKPFTEWGRDPVFETGELERLVTSDIFLNADAVRTAEVPVRTAKDSERVVEHVIADLALFDVRCDPDSLRYYVDIEIDPHGSYSPFIRLQLVRDQVDAVRGFETSLPTEVMARVLPARALAVRRDGDGVTLEYSGVVFYDMAPARDVRNQALDGSPGPEAAPPPVPRLDVDVLRRLGDRAGNSGLPLPGAGTGTLTAVNLVDWEPAISGTIGTWRIRLSEGEKAVGDPQDLRLASGALKAGIVVLLRETESYLREELVQNDNGVEWYNLLPVKRTVASMAVTIRV